MGRPEEPSGGRGGVILASVPVDGCARGTAEFESLEWLEDSKHPLDWNGPTGRIFTRFRDEDLD